MGVHRREREKRRHRGRAGLAAGLAVWLLCACGSAVAGDVIERVVARVNGRIILQSEWDREVRCEALLAGTGLAQAQASQATLQAALDRLIEHQLLRGEGTLTKRTSPEGAEVKSRLAELRAASSLTDADAGWREELARYGLTEAELAEHLAGSLDLERVVEIRLRPGLRVEPEDVQRYYADELAPRLQQANTEVPPLEDVAPKIREVLLGRAMNRALDLWLAEMRANAEIWLNPAVANRAADSGGVSSAGQGGTQ